MKRSKPSVLTLLFSASLLVTACGGDPRQTQPTDEPRRRIEVEVMTIEPQTVVGHIKSLGVMESAEAITINVEFSAPVKRVYVREGQRVDAGDKLLSFDTSKLKLQREQTLQNIAQAESQRENEAANLRRLTVLAEQQSVSQQQLDNAVFASQGLEAKVKQLQAKLSLIDKDLKNSQVLSPLSGVIGERLVEVGESTSAMQPLFSLEADNSMKFVCYVSESVLSLIEEGLPATVSTVNGAFESSIYSIAAKADANTGNFEVKVLLDNSLGQFRPGMTGDVELTTLAVKDQIILPEQVLTAYSGEHVVYRIEGGKAIRQPVSVRLGFEDRLMITKGLALGQVIATTHVTLLTDGTEVDVQQ